MATLPQGSSIGDFPYYVQKRLNTGQGAMSEVYLAIVGQPTPDEPDPPLVVLKIARVQDRHGEFHHQALDNEVERLRRLKHPGIVRLYPIRRPGIPNLPYIARSGLEGQPWFSVMEYLPGGSLATLIERQHRLDIGLALEITRTLAATLDYLHSREQVHLDIKPENILFRTDPLDVRVEPVLIDFGIARDIGQGGLTAATVRYSPPERLRASQNRTQAPELAVPPHPSMDIYSLGMVLYHMIAGCLPFQGRDPQSLTSAILEGSPTSPSTHQPMLTTELDELILMAINRDPARRPTAEELAVALEATAIKLGYTPGSYRGPSSKPDGASSVPHPVTSKSTKPLLPIGMAALMIVMLAFIVGFTDWGRLGRVFGGPTPTTTSAIVAQLPPTEIPTPSAIAKTVDSPTSKTVVASITSKVPLASPTVHSPTPGPGPAPSIFPSSTPAPTPTETTLFVRLVRPSDGEGSSTVITFEWQPSGALPPGQYFELVFWREGENRKNAFGVYEPTRVTQIPVEIGELVEDETHPLGPGDYRWGVLLVEQNPYRRIRWLSNENRRFRVE